MRRFARILAGLAVLAAGLAASCSKNPTSPSQEPVLSGVVVDAASQPVANARVEISYPYAPPGPAPARLLDIPVPVPVVGPRSFMVANNPCTLGTVSVHFGLPADAQVTCGVLNRAGATVRTLLSRSAAAGTYIVNWDGRDDSTNPVPADVYRVLLIEIQGDSTFAFTADALWDPSDPNTAHQLTADPDGRFFVALSQLPIGVTIHARSSAGDSLGDFKVGGLIRVAATGPEGGIATVGGATITNSGGSATVVVRLP